MDFTNIRSWLYDIPFGISYTTHFEHKSKTNQVEI